MTAPIHTIGCILDHGCRNVEELSIAIVEFAKSHGHSASVEYESDAYDPTSVEYEPELLDEEMDSAIDYLNSLDLPPYTYYGNDGEAGAFGLWPDLEEANGNDGVLRVDDTCEIEHVAHVNDHGNVTLYTVELTEVWSVV